MSRKLIIDSPNFVPSHPGVLPLLKSILSIGGQKMITLCIDNEPHIFDISKDGVIGYEPNHELVFLMKLERSFNSIASLIVREFTWLYSVDSCVKIPYKRLYGCMISKGRVHPLTKEQMRDAHTLDPRTGKRISQEKAVLFSDFPSMIE